MKESGKYLIESQSVFVNLKIAVQEFEKNPDYKEHHETIVEVLRQIADLATLYGVNSVVKLANKFSELMKSIGQKKVEVNDDVLDISGETEQLLPQIAEDPMLNDQNLKLKYEHAFESIDMIIAGESSDEDNSGDLENKKFQDVFAEEAFDLINQLEEKMLQLESDPDDEKMIDDVFRIMHTLKGNSNMFGFVYLGEITHQLEDIYDNIRAGKTKLSRPILEITLECIDHFRNLIDDIQLSDPENKALHESILERIANILGGKEEVKPEADQDEVKNVEVTGETKTYYLYFKPASNVFDDGTNPLYFVYDLYELGECKLYPVYSKALKNGSFNPEQCNTLWHILLATKSGEEEIGEHFMFMNEDSQPVIKLLTNTNLLKNKKFIEYFEKDVTSEKPIDKLEIEKFLVEQKQPEQQKNNKKTGSNGSKEAISSVRVAAQKIDQMMNLISELVTKQAELTLLSSNYENQRLSEVAESIENISRDLRDTAFSISLIPLDKSVLRFQRLVRDVSNRFNKKVNFIVEGKETELDKTIIEKIIDPIMHILRNSIDHGIETPAERKKIGKPETGIIKLKAYPSGAHVVIEISDDGAGINLEKVKKTALKRGMIDETESIGREDLLNMIISPGFSTAENISEVSGRGVGMDVVNQKISEIRGELDIKTEEGKGTTITINLPLTISIIDSLLVKIRKDFYIIPLAVVDRCSEVKSLEVLESVNRYVIMNDEYIPFVDLRKEFGIEEDRPEIQQTVLVNYRDNIVAIVVDEVVGNYQAVLKSLGDAYKKQETISGASILGSGEVALVLDTNKIIQEFATQIEKQVNAV